MDSFAAADVPSSSSSGGGVVGRGGGDAGEHGKRTLFGAALSVAIPSPPTKKELKMQPPVRCSFAATKFSFQTSARSIPKYCEL